MSDEVDNANDHIAKEEALRIKQISERAPEATPTGVCLECGEGVGESKRWCSAGCRDIWDFRRRTHRR